MFQRFDHRGGHYTLLIAVWASCCLIKLGLPALWDIDEGLNARAAQEMLDSGNFVVPTFNAQLRSAKPVLLYWFQVGCYHLFGVNETAARLPSALAALLAILGTYELGRRALGSQTGLLGGLILATSLSFLGAAHFANPDALLVGWTTLSLMFFYRDYSAGGRGYLGASAITMALAVLAKGPVGLVLPMAVMLLFLLWQGDLRRLLDARVPGAALLFTLIALPWYVLVSVETRGAYLREFLSKQHLDRITTPLEGHSGPLWYYVPVLLVGLVPWSIFAGPVVQSAWRGLRQPASQERTALRFLTVWILVYLVPFSIVVTKLPNYILPLYPALALLTARLLCRWRQGEIDMPDWVVRGALVCLMLIGTGVTAGLLMAAGVIDLPNLRSRAMPGMLPWAWVGLILVGGATLAWRMLGRGQRSAVLNTLLVSAVAFVAIVGSAILPAANPIKASRGLASALPADHQYRDIRLGAYRCFQPSMVFYCRREVTRLELDQHALGFLREPWPTYLFVPEPVWETLRDKAPSTVRVIGRQRDLYNGNDILVVTTSQRDSEEVVQAQP